MKKQVFSLAVLAAALTVGGAALAQQAQSAPPLALPGQTGQAAAPVAATAAPTPAAKPAAKPRAKPAATKARPSVSDAVASQEKVNPLLDAAVSWVSRMPVKPKVVNGVAYFQHEDTEPTLVCAPLRSCLIELAPDEAYENHVLGDPSRWELVLMQQGPRTLIAFKPSDFKLQTNLIVVTTKRTYSVALVSDTENYFPRYAFTYKGGWVGNPGQNIKRPGDMDPKAPVDPRSPYQAAIDSTLPGPAATLFEYEIKGEAPFKPVRAYSDGKKTFIQLPPVLRELPTIFVLGRNGALGAMPNHRFVRDKNLYIADAVLEAVRLQIGGGSSAMKVDLKLIEEKPPASN